MKKTFLALIVRLTILFGGSSAFAQTKPSDFTNSTFSKVTLTAIGQTSSAVNS